MIKRISILFLLLILIFAVCSCGKNKGDFDDMELDVNELAGELSEYYGKGDAELVPIEGEALDIRYGLSGLYTYLYAEASVTVTSDELIVLEADSAENAEKAYNLIDSYRKERASLFATYAPDEVSKLDDAYLVRVGKYVVFAASADTDGAKKILEGYCD